MITIAGGILLAYGVIKYPELMFLLAVAAGSLFLIFCFLVLIL